MGRDILDRIRDSAAAYLVVGGVTVCGVAGAAYLLSPPWFAWTVLAAFAIRASLAALRPPVVSHGIEAVATRSVRMWFSCTGIAVIAGASVTDIANAGALAMTSIVYLPWFVLLHTLLLRRTRTTRSRRHPATPADIPRFIREDASPTAVASAGVLATALAIIEYLGGAGHVVNGAVFVTPGSVLLVAVGCIALMWGALLLRALAACAAYAATTCLAAVGVVIMLAATAVATATISSLVGSAFGFAVGALLVAVSGYVLAVPGTFTVVTERQTAADPISGEARATTSVSAEHILPGNPATTSPPGDPATTSPPVDPATTSPPVDPARPAPPADRAAAKRAYLGVCIFILFAVLVPAVVIGAGPSRSGNLWLLIVPILVLSSLRLAWLVRRGERRLLEMTFWVFTYTFMGLAPLAQIRDHSSPATVPRPSWDLVPQAAALVLVGAVAFFLGTYLASRTSKPPLDSRASGAGGATGTEELSPITVSYRRLIVVSVFTILLNAYYLLHVGIIQFTTTRIDALIVYKGVWATGTVGILILPATYMSLLVTWVAWMRYRREMTTRTTIGDRVTPSERYTSLGFAIVLGLLLANTMNPISNARYLSGTAMLAAAVAFGLFSTPNKFRAMTVTFILALVVIFPLADAFRFTTSADFKTSGPVESLLSPDYDSFAQVSNGLLLAARDGIEPGRQLLGVILWWFPRSAWPDKPHDTGILIADGRGYPFTNLSAPLWIEFFMNGGWILVILGMAAVGYFLHRWDTAIDAQMHHSKMPTILGSILPFYLLILLRGSLLQAMSYLTFILVFAFLVRARTRHPGGTFDRRWLPESLRYADINPNTEATPPEPMSRREPAHVH